MAKQLQVDNNNNEDTIMHKKNWFPHFNHIWQAVCKFESVCEQYNRTQREEVKISQLKGKKAHKARKAQKEVLLRYVSPYKLIYWDSYDNNDNDSCLL